MSVGALKRAGDKIKLKSTSELSRLMERSAAPARFPTANTTDAQSKH